MNDLTGQNIPRHLIEEIRQGNCVAFVGAGFSAPAVPDWDTLLSRIAQSPQINDLTRERITGLLGHEKTSLRGVFDREAAAQILRESLGGGFGSVLNDVIRQTSASGIDAVESRKDLLFEIPFQSILTTNFDHMLSGTTGNPDVYRESLRKVKEPWFNLFSWTTGGRLSEVVKLHGDIESTSENPDPEVVLTRTDYRKLLFEDSRYSNFLRALLATRTVLFLGFSFSDGYLNLIRSEILALLRHDPLRPPAYAVLENIDPGEADFLLRHEGIEALVYDSKNGDHSGFDAYLEKIHEQTAPARIIGRLLDGKRLLWLDPRPDNNLYGMDLIRQSTIMDCEVVECASPSEALRHLSETQFDLVVTHWGHGLSSDSSGIKRANAVELLEGIRVSKLEVPVIVFASPDPEHVHINRLKAISLGAFEYTWTFEDLFQSIEKIFRCGACGEAVRIVERPQDQEVMTPIWCEGCKIKAGT